MQKKYISILLTFLSSLVLANSGFNIAGIEKRALDNSKFFESDASEIITQANKLAENADIDKKQFIDLQKNLLSKYKKDNKPSNDTLIFISFSMPDEAIKSILNDSFDNNASVVINGLYENSMKATLKKISEFINESNNKSGIEINPNLFDEHKITKVPAYVFISNNDYDTVYGASSIQHAKDVIDSRGAL